MIGKEVKKVRFNSTAYDKLYPRQKKKETVETAVETFTPTTDEQKVETDDEGENDDGDGRTGNNDSE